MEFNKPAWRIKTPCPDCGQGNPVFYICKRCEYLTLYCEETGDFYVDPKNLEKGFSEVCPNCKTSTDNFDLADSSQILRAGFLTNDYE